MWRLHQEQHDVIEQRISQLQEEHDKLARQFLSAQQKKESAADQLSEAHHQINSLEDKQVELSRSCQEKQDHIKQQHANIQQAKNEYEKITIEFNQAQYKINAKKEEASRLKKELEKLKLAQKELISQINKQNDIISKPSPTPQYRIDREYCENGIYHCINHPPRQVLTNDYEIKQHQKNVEEAKNAKAALLKQLEKLEMEINRLQSQFSAIKTEVTRAELNYQRLQDQLTAKQNYMQEAQQRCKQDQTAYEKLLAQLTMLNSRLELAKQSVEDATSQLFTAELDMSLFQDQITEILQQIRVLESQLKQTDMKKAEVEALAKKEMTRQELLEKIAKRELLEELARQELVDEQLEQAQNDRLEESANSVSSNPESFFGSTAAKLQGKATQLEKNIEATADKAQQLGQKVLRKAAQGVTHGVQNVKEITKFFGNELSNTLESTFQDVDKMTQGF